MKRITLLIVFFVVSSLLFSSSAFTYSFSQMGEKCGEKSFGSFTASVGFAPLKEKQYGYVEAGILLGWDRLFQGFDITLSCPVFISSDEVFSYAFSNRVLWEPTVGAAAQYRADGKRWGMAVMFSPLKFVDTSFSYELLSPYITFGFDGSSSFGMRIVKVTAFLEV